MSFPLPSSVSATPSLHSEEEKCYQQRCETKHVVAYDFPLGLLINFGGQSLQYKLIFNPKYHPNPNSENSKIQ